MFGYVPLLHVCLLSTALVVCLNQARILSNISVAPLPRALICPAVSKFNSGCFHA